MIHSYRETGVVRHILYFSPMRGKFVHRREWPANSKETVVQATNPEEARDKFLAEVEGPDKACDWGDCGDCDGCPE